MEAFWRFILRMVFATGLVELLVLLPKGNGKTAVLAALAVFHVLVTPNAQCFVAAADKEQADELYRFAQHYIEAPEHSLRAYLLVRPSTRVVRARRDQGFIRVLASDKTQSGGKKHSYNPTLAIIEELHAHENENTYVAMRSAAFKRGGLVLDISTAGWDQKSTLGRLRTGFLAVDQHGGRVRRGMRIDARGRLVRDRRRGRLTVCESKTRRNVMLEWACTPDDDLSDLKVVKLANPASWVTTGTLQDALEAPGITPWQFARYRANVWTLGFKSWLPHGAWDRLAIGEHDPSPYAWITDWRRVCFEAPPRLGVQPGDRIFLAVDMARYRDSAAITVVAPRGKEPPAIWLPFLEQSQGEDNPIAYQPVIDAIRELDRVYRLLAAGFDPKYFDQAAEELEQMGIPMVKFPQSNERMCPASADFRTAVIKRGLRHDGDPLLAAHVTAGAARDVGADQFKLAKPASSGPPIDGGIAGVMAWRLAHTEGQPSVYETRGLEVL